MKEYFYTQNSLSLSTNILSWDLEKEGKTGIIELLWFLYPEGTYSWEHQIWDIKMKPDWILSMLSLLPLPSLHATATEEINSTQDQSQGNCIKNKIVMSSPKLSNDMMEWNSFLLELGNIFVLFLFKESKDKTQEAFIVLILFVLFFHLTRCQK